MIINHLNQPVLRNHFSENIFFKWSIMKFLSFLESKKHKQLIRTVRAYYNQEATSISYTSEQIQKTIDWLLSNDKEDSHLLIEKLQMAKHIASSRKIRSKALV